MNLMRYTCYHWHVCSINGSSSLQNDWAANCGQITLFIICWNCHLTFNYRIRDRIQNMLNSNYYYSKINSSIAIVKFFNEDNRINNNFNRYNRYYKLTSLKTQKLLRCSTNIYVKNKIMKFCNFWILFREDEYFIIAVED